MARTEISGNVVTPDPTDAFQTDVLRNIEAGATDNGDGTWTLTDPAMVTFLAVVNRYGNSFGGLPSTPGRGC